ncbi:MAG: SDR family oxidoreductase [Bdellovibrionales bacterium]|nr:SDR family oxidoreductase [Bdellovibrionales bacterium]
MKVDLSGKSALVCGASKGIGKAIVEELSEQGARVILLSRDKDALESLKKRLTQPERHFVLGLDFNNLPELIDQVRQMVEELSVIYILVCNSSGPKSGPLLEAKPDEFLKAFQQHILANHLLAQLLVPKMIETGFGRIINIISTSVKMPIAQLGVSNTIRGAVANWSKTLANELGPFGVTVNNVLPGYTATERLDSLLTQTAKASGRSSQEIGEEWKKAVPLRRFADPRETARAVAFLASSAADYINGINLPVDGGRLACL